VGTGQLAGGGGGGLTGIYTPSPLEYPGHADPQLRPTRHTFVPHVAHIATNPANGPPSLVTAAGLVPGGLPYPPPHRRYSF
jgi:hypothetical protein